MSQNNNLDEIVRKITQQVVERLQSGGAGMQAGGSCGDAPCLLSMDNCDGCGHCATIKKDACGNIINSGAVRIGAKPGFGEKIDHTLAKYIDHTLLKADATREELLNICDEAKRYQFATVCVNASNIPLVARQLRGSGVKPIAVVGFPLGASTSHAKAFEAKEAIRNGAQEIDMVINIGALKSREYQLVYEDIREVVKASAPYKVKVILENSSLTDEEKVIACTLSKTAGAAFVKTSTGFGSGGATVEDVELMRRVVGCDMEVKASGGVRSREDAEKMIKAGANRIGASASIAIVTGKKAAKGKY